MRKPAGLVSWARRASATDDSQTSALGHAVDRHRVPWAGILRHSLDLHVSVLEHPLVVLLEKDRADQPDDDGFLRKMRTTSARRLTLSQSIIRSGRTHGAAHRDRA
jgi:hypothetical protein